MLLNEGLPIAVISERQRLMFPTEEDLGRAWALGVFYLKIPDPLHLDSAREFGCGLLDPDSPYRKIPKYGDLEGFIALENNQQTKLALCRHHWDQHYPAAIARFGRQLDDIGVAIICEVFHQSGIPEPLWSRASGGYASGAGTAFLNFVHYDTRNPDLGLRPHTDYGFVTILDATTLAYKLRSPVSLRMYRFFPVIWSSTSVKHCISSRPTQSAPWVLSFTES